MHFSKISVAAISMALFSLASAAPATQTAPIEARSNCFGDAIAAGSSCAVDCFKQGGDTGDCILGCNTSTLSKLAGCLVSGN
ncbi:hypothetical protein MCOR27_003273 [Pyricularia oryzae]|uniref:Extracellular membrane protein CFEM domain-containing protein n=2 Tax=Pyricularia TaxID=48558 RepID=A0ABQ8NQ82_PYRGI|nr:hypothetical protein MCOR01_011612 [Pyricularia oryzae]KAI6300513.1 hypothetical protein MCOR33_003787 [Pyricularia grisea]KAH9439957.1 hypothetical protein MCOR02_003491 [Pyricularia oryzae]KAI6260834.1 hypothetical protein MCOR19_002931 [Pyricularia oryzae]KAI6268320.1 hypothetical protein MCOR26_009280 [Pyricularia oryzae]